MPQPAPHPPSPPVLLNYVYCDRPDSFANAVHFLRSAPYLILDCEGKDLGRSGGSVTLICVGTPFAEYIFLFDVLSPYITRNDVQGLLDLFQNKGLLKVVWDGRMDFLEIWSTYGVALRGVLDLQIAEVMSRYQVRGEEDDGRLLRLQQSLRIPPSKMWHDRYDYLHAVVGLQRCWKECGYAEDCGKDPEIMHMHKALGSSMWAFRPLTEQLLQYAARDILLIGVLYPHFIRSGWIPMDPPNFSSLLTQCQRYVSAHVEQGKSTETDIFKPSCIIPLDVLTEPSGPKYLCFACNRALSETAFETKKDLNSAAYKSVTKGFMRSTRCRLCFALACKKNAKVDQAWVST
ncbi:ribonuclease H-like domain-containing protein [Irpex rosettiformis]|uniref:Ribonuclease H-like domain-containing protein n=1 Tax=Irpex rosettiformis TaxID=378272 RepID=A0ACB8TYU5_9APHY|nr:ribonuclease H-like domain-containing protein [Irpex rosettiformis]